MIYVDLLLPLVSFCCSNNVEGGLNPMIFFALITQFLSTMFTMQGLKFLLKVHCLQKYKKNMATTNYSQNFA
jgi:hypothetical protein